MDRIGLMVADQVPDEIKRFVLRCFDSVVQLEALLLLRQSPAERWTADAVSRRLYVSEKVAREALVHLSEAGFSVSDSSETVTYSYKPLTDDHAKMVDGLADIYNKQLVSVTNLIHSKQESRIQQFSDAFKFRE